MWNQSGKFSIAGGGDEFANRQQNLFATLDAVEEARNSRIPVNEPVESPVSLMDFDTSQRIKRQKRSDTKHLRGKESLFKRPDAPPPWQLRRTPDYQKNPHKWTKYSLGDVTQDDMSDRTNTSTALSFLNELRNRKKSEESASHASNTDAGGSSIVFKRPSKSLRQSIIKESVSQESPVFRGTKRVMPEYIVGQDFKKPNPKEDKSENKKSRGKHAELKLGHLLEQVDDDETTD